MKRSARAASWLAPTPPTVAVELASRRVTAVKLGGAPGRPVVSAYASEPLPDGAIVPALSGVNLPDPGRVAEAVGRAMTRAGLSATRRVALVVPDSIARVSLLQFEQMPPRAADLDELVRWQLRKATPFPLDEAQITYFRAGVSGAGATVAAVVARVEVVRQYEAVVEAVGLHAGLVDLASFNVMNAVIAAGRPPAGDWLLVHLAAEATTLAILRGSDLMFYRHRTAVDEEPLRALVHQTAMYHEDRLAGAAFERVWISGGQAANPARQEISERLQVPAEPVELPLVALAGDHPASADVLDALAAPVGVLLREREAA